MDNNDIVRDDEELYRRIRRNAEEPVGILTITQEKLQFIPQLSLIQIDNLP